MGFKNSLKGIVWIAILSIVYQRASAGELGKSCSKIVMGDAGYGSLPATNIGQTVVKFGGIDLILVRIPAGIFNMGSEKGLEDEKPVHSVTISKAFWMGKYEVTQGQFQAVMGWNNSDWKRPDSPVGWVTWDDAQTFIFKINNMQTAFTYRLPTEAEWEYACRAGSSEETYGPLKRIAWFGRPIVGKVHPVGQKEPNAFGIFDMLGNVSEWCQDWYGPYSLDAAVDPLGPTFGIGKITRGGSYLTDASACRAAKRAGAVPPAYRHRSLGFRVVANPRDFKDFGH